MSTAHDPAHPAGRPDPFSVPRRPMARASGGVLIAASRARPGDGPLWIRGDVDVDRWYALIDDADVALEGRAEGPRFDGSACLRVPLAAADQRAILAILPTDPRLEVAVADRVRRELAALLGPRTPRSPTVLIRARRDGDFLRLDVDIEGIVSAAEHPDAR